MWLFKNHQCIQWTETLYFYFILNRTQLNKVQLYDLEKVKIRPGVRGSDSQEGTYDSLKGLIDLAIDVLFWFFHFLGYFQICLVYLEKYLCKIHLYFWLLIITCIYVATRKAIISSYNIYLLSFRSIFCKFLFETTHWECVILTSYFTYICYTFRIRKGFLNISVRVIKKYLIYYFDSSTPDFIDFKTN